jgi:hypothetical protein
MSFKHVNALKLHLNFQNLKKIPPQNQTWQPRFWLSQDCLVELSFCPRPRLPRLILASILAFRGVLAFCDDTVQILLILHWVIFFLNGLKFPERLPPYLFIIGLSIENFIPLLDYKERAQQWKWIGQSRDSDEQLVPLCKHWLDNRNDTSLEAVEAREGSPPPPRM